MKIYNNKTRTAKLIKVSVIGSNPILPTNNRVVSSNGRAVLIFKRLDFSGCGPVWLGCVIWDHEVQSSSLCTPTVAIA